MNQPALFQDFTTDHDLLHSRIDSLSNYTFTSDSAILDTVGAAVGALKTSRRALVLLSDGDDNASAQYHCQSATDCTAALQALVQFAKQDQVTIYTIGYGDTGVTYNHNAHQIMTTLASGTGGAYYSATDSSALQGIFQSLAGLVAGGGTPEQYLITYKSADGGVPNHNITLTAISGGSVSVAVAASVNACASNPTPPSPGGVTPGSGSGFGQVLQVTFSDPRGWQDLNVIDILINGSLDGRQACYLAYSVPLGVLYLVDDGGALLALTLNGYGSVSNSQCTVTGAGSSATESGNTFTLVLNLSFSAAFAGNKIVFMAAGDQQGGNSGWQALGTWGVPVTPSGTITVVSLAPARVVPASGTAQTLAATLTDRRGVGDFGVVNLLVNDFIDGRHACYLAYVASSNSLLLVDDAGDAGGRFAGSLVLNGSAGTIQNSQCSISGTGSSARQSSNTLILTLNVTFTPASAGDRIVWVAGRDAQGGNNTGWQAMGTNSVQ